jgi:hypothetical protein
MNTHIANFLIVVSLCLGLDSVRAQVTFSAGVEIHATADFEAPLAAEGAWITVGSHGRCWHPARVEANWRPYCDGSWVWTDCGWYWQSDEPWAWACYHYGSWVDDPSAGWVWIPGTEWAPAWVTWREGSDFIGWAPCGPGGVVVADPFFVFVDIHRFNEPIRRDEVIINHTDVIRQTKVINNIRREDHTIDGARTRVVINEGPGVAKIQTATRATFAARPIRDVARETRPPANFHHDPVATPAQPRPIDRETARPGESAVRAPVTEPSPDQPEPGQPRTQAEVPPPTRQEEVRPPRETPKPPVTEPKPSIVGRDQEKSPDEKTAAPHERPITPDEQTAAPHERPAAPEGKPKPPVHPAPKPEPPRKQVPEPPPNHDEGKDKGPPEPGLLTEGASQGPLLNCGLRNPRFDVRRSMA